MFLDRFLKPKWQHPDPQVRKQGLLKLEPNQPHDLDILHRLAAEDSDADVRRTAVKRLSDFERLRQRASQDPDAGVREVATARYRQLLGGGAEGADLALRLRELERCEGEAVLAYVARRGREPELRAAALERLDNEHVLEEIVLNDAVPRLRQQALARLQEPAALERVAERMREKDRKLARAARERLSELEQASEAAAQAERERRELCAAMEALSAGERARGEFLRLCNRWEQVAGAVTEPLAQRFEQARAAAEQHLAAPAPEPEPAPVSKAAVEPDPAAAALAALQDGLEPDALRLLELKELLPAGDTHARRLLDEYLPCAERYLEREAELAGVLEELEAAPADPQHLLRRMTGLLDGIAWDSPLPAPALLRRAQTLRGELAQAQRTAEKDQAAELAELETVLARLREALAQGSLRQSRRELTRALRLAERLGGRERSRLERELKRYGAKVAELKDWRRFATLPKQEQLCAEMEGLIEAEVDPETRAARIKALRQEWKATGGADSAEARALWERFNAAAERAFEPCRAYFDEQAAARTRNLEERRRVAAQLEEFMATANVDALAVPALLRIRDQARREWLAAAPVPRGGEAKTLERDFEARMDALTQRLHAQQDAHRAAKQGLVDAARALIEQEDVRAAIEEAKNLQAQWREIGQARPAQERKLWSAFRKACDELFARRDQAREAVHAERKAQEQRAEVLCAEAEALRAERADELARARSRWGALQAELRGLGRLPRVYESRLQAVAQRLEREEAALARAQAEAALAATRAQAELCASLERAVLEDAEAARTAFAKLEAEWSRHPAGELAPRWQQAVRALEEGGFAPTALTANLEARRALCVRLEILAGVESPPEDRALRMQLQVARLHKGMSEKEREQPVAAELEREWLMLGPAPLAESECLARRFAAARQAIS